MKQTVGELHTLALPHTWSSRRGVAYVAWLYRLVNRFGFVQYATREGEIVGVISGIGRLILTLVVHPKWQGKGIGSLLISKLAGTRYVYTEAQSLGFYRKMGFIIVGKFGTYFILRRQA